MIYLVAIALASEDAMNALTGTQIIHTDTQFSVYLWTNPNQTDLNTIQDKVQLLGMVSLYLP